MNRLTVFDLNTSIPLFEVFHGPAGHLEIQRYKDMAIEYRLALIRRPYLNRCQLALMVGARAFRIDVDLLQKASRGELSATRHKLMAFSRIISPAPERNPWKRIATAFHCHHSTVVYATHKYSDRIETALQERAR